MNVYEYARTILEGRTLKEKLTSCENLNKDFLNVKSIEYTLPKYPARSYNIQFDNGQLKFPRKNTFHLKESRAQALHFFANHELMAIEMMAAALAMFPHETKDMQLMKRGLIETIKDEQKHLMLYINRMQDLGISFGDYPLNDFFWRQMPQLKTPEKFYAVVALTFEQANLDFAQYYQNIFNENEDTQSASIMEIIIKDEIRHVSIGNRWLNKWRGEKPIWDYYLTQLPHLLSPARAKGMSFNFDARKSAGLAPEFIDKILNYRDDFKITNRKEW